MTSALIVQTRKEVRALFPWTIGVAVATIALAELARRNAGFPNFRADQQVFFLMAYAIGVLTVAALSVGHELTHGTLAALLVQPVDRAKVLRLKLAVLTIALTGLGLLASTLIQHDYVLQGGVIPRRLLIWAPVAAGVGLVPLLTMLSRRPLGGVVFAVTIPGLLLGVGEQMYPLHLGVQALEITWYGTLAASAFGLAALLVQFRRLQVAGDGRESASVSPAIVTRDVPKTDYRPTVRRPWVWLLIKKELRLQQMTLAVSGLYVLGAAAVMVLQERDLAHYVGPTFSALSILHAYFIPLIAGGVASAEERHTGTLAGQVLQPRDMRVQWAIKVMVTIGLTLALAFGLPALLMVAHKPVETFRMESDFVLGISLVCTAAMYVSSISSNTLWALLGCFPVLGIAALVGGWGYTFLRSMVRQWFLGPGIDSIYLNFPLLFKDMAVRKAYFGPREVAYRDITFSLSVIQMGLILGFGLLVLYLAARNHRMLDRAATTVGRQILTVLVYAAAATTAYLAIARMAWSWLGY